jgi:hypothetical protein
MSQRLIGAGSTDVSVVLRIVDSADGTPEQAVTSATGGLNFWYRREAGALNNIAPLSDLAALTDAHSDGGLLHQDDGYYRLDVPDAAFASGAPAVMIGGVATGMVVIGTYYQINTTGITIFPAGAIEFTYTVTETVSGDPIEGAEVWISTDIAGNNVIWKGDTDAFGVAMDVNGELPMLDAGTYYFWSQKAGYTFVNPDTEVVS